MGADSALVQPRQDTVAASSWYLEALKMSATPLRFYRLVFSFQHHSA